MLNSHLTHDTLPSLLKGSHSSKFRAFAVPPFKEGLINDSLFFCMSRVSNESSLHFKEHFTAYCIKQGKNRCYTFYRHFVSYDYQIIQCIFYLIVMDKTFILQHYPVLQMFPFLYKHILSYPDNPNVFRISTDNLPGILM